MLKNIIPNDVSMCNNITCEKRHSCKRFRQIHIDISNKITVGVSVNKFEPVNDCEFYIK